MKQAMAMGLPIVGLQLCAGRYGEATPISRRSSGQTGVTAVMVVIGLVIPEFALKIVAVPK